MQCESTADEELVIDKRTNHVLNNVKQEMHGIPYYIFVHF